MSDRGEKIVHLAQEMLQGGELSKAHPPKQTNKRRKEKAVFRGASVAATLTNAETATVTYIKHEQKRLANRYERTEIEALIFYASRELGIELETIKSGLAEIIGKTGTDSYSAANYKRARHYLQNRLVSNKDDSPLTACADEKTE